MFCKNFRKFPSHPSSTQKLARPQKRNFYRTFKIPRPFLACVCHTQTRALWTFYTCAFDSAAPDAILWFTFLCRCTLLPFNFSILILKEVFDNLSWVSLKVWHANHFSLKLFSVFKCKKIELNWLLMAKWDFYVDYFRERK